MARIPFDGFVGPTYTGKSTFVDAESLINMYPEVAGGGAKAKARITYYGTPGCQFFTQLPGQIWAVASTHWGISGGSFFQWAIAGSLTAPFLYRINEDGTFVVQVNGGGAPAALTQPGGAVLTGWRIVANTTQLFLLPIGTGLNAASYYLDIETEHVFQITDADYPTACAGTYLDGFIVVAKPSSQAIFASDFEDVSSWNALSTGTQLIDPDIIVGLIADHEQLWVFGTNKIQVWYNAGLSPFPFAPVPGAVMEVGCAASESICRLDNGLFWLGSDERGAGVAYRNRGYEPIRISTNAIEAAWQSYTVISDAIGYPVQINGHSWFVLSFPTAGATWVYDATTGMWFQWMAWSLTTNTFFPTLARFHAFDHVSNRHLVGGGDISGNLYELSPNIFTDDGNGIKRVRRSPHVSEEMLRVFYSQIQFDMQVGSTESLVDGNGKPRPAYINLRWSNDGGNTWGNDNQISIGSTGQYQVRVQMNRLGSGRNRVFEWSITDPVPVALIAAWLDVEPGTN